MLGVYQSADFPGDGLCARQEWEDLYEAGLGLERGTIFSQLDKPFIGEEAVLNAGKYAAK